MGMHHPTLHYPWPHEEPLPACILSAFCSPFQTPAQVPGLSCSPLTGPLLQPPTPSSWHTHLTSWVHGHLLPCRPALLTLLPLGGHIADKDNITGASRLQRDGMHPEVLKHIENGLEPQMLDPALTLLIQ